MKQNTVQYFVFIISIFLLIVSPTLFSRGMFADGLQYAAISRNLAHGIGNFWDLHLTNYLYPHFHEHPPLVFYLQSLWFQLFGNSIYVERFYSLFVFILTAILIVLIWREITKTYKNYWVPLLLLISIPKISWACANNMLENTMMVFTTLSALFYLKSLKNNRFVFLLFSGIALTAALFSKGFTSLYIWSFPFWIFVFDRKMPVKRMIADMFLLVIFTLLPLALLLIFSVDAKNSLSAYFTRQIIGSFKYGQTVNSRFNILLDFLSGIILPVLTAALVYVVAVKKKVHIKNRGFNGMAAAFFALSLSGVLPIMVSLKQSSFYILTVYPLFVISLALMLSPYITGLFSSLKNRQKLREIFSRFVYPFFVFSVAFSYLQIYGKGRDNETISDVVNIIEYTGKNEDIGINKNLYDNWALHGYFARYGNISLDPDNINKHRFFISKNDIKDSLFLKNFEKSPAKTKTLVLYKKRE